MGLIARTRRSRRILTFLAAGIGAWAMGGLVAAVAVVSDSKETPGAAEQEPAPIAAPGLKERLAEKGMVAGSPIMIRIFKLESELELWMLRQGRYELFKTYKICNWSGRLGPKMREGDRQAPEGLYSVGESQIHRRGRWPRSLNIGYPNAFDRSYARTGSLILVHGGCTSTGCFAMTNQVMEEIYRLAEQALEQGQERFQVHVFPFRMTESNLAIYRHEEWQPFWLNLKNAYDLFERTRMPPQVSVCNKRYVVTEAAASGASGGLAARAPACVETEPSASATGEAAAPEHATTRGRKVASKTRAAPRPAGRNTRKAYAEARRARMAAHARRGRATAMAGSRRTH